MAWHGMGGLYAPLDTAGATMPPPYQRGTAKGLTGYPALAIALTKAYKKSLKRHIGGAWSTMARHGMKALESANILS